MMHIDGINRQPIAKDGTTVLFNGVTPLPFGAVSISADGRICTSIIMPLEKATNRQRAIIAAVKKNSFDPRGQFREAGALFFQRAGHKPRIAHFTSNKPDAIENKDFMDAITDGMIDRELAHSTHDRRPPTIVHVHSHPSAAIIPDKNLNVLISDPDHNFYRLFATYFSAIAQRDIEILGVVCPVGPACDHQIIITTERPKSGFSRTRAAGFLKRMQLLW